MATVAPAPGSMATGHGRGGSGGGGDDPRRNQPPSSHQYGTPAQREKILNLLKALVDRRIADKNNAGGTHGEIVMRKHRKVDVKRMKVRNPETIAIQLEGKSRPDYIVPLEHLIRADRLHTGSDRCNKCQRESGPFPECRTIRGVFGGACSNCMYGQRAAACSFYQDDEHATPSSEPSSAAPTPELSVAVAATTRTHRPSFGESLPHRRASFGVPVSGPRSSRAPSFNNRPPHARGPGGLPTLRAVINALREALALADERQRQGMFVPPGILNLVNNTPGFLLRANYPQREDGDVFEEEDMQEK